MCGIVGMIANENVCESLLKGLERLEYRGYDSAGIYLANQEERSLIKAQGPIKTLTQKITPAMNGTVGIGHTRWATHGIPSEANAHPHQSEHGKVVLVHNGVIENYKELKAAYLHETTLRGETDTEVIVNIIEQFMELEGLNVKDAFKKVLTMIQGSYAFALIDPTNPTHFYAAKHKSPLLVGCGPDFNLVGSDALAMIHQTDQLIELQDGELVTLTTDAVQIETIDGKIIQRDPYIAQIDNNSIDKGTYPFYMLKEIEEQPLVMRRLQQKYLTQDGDCLIDKKLIQKIAESDRLYIVACGTSYHAGLAAKGTIENWANIPVEVHVASEFGYHMPLLTAKPFFIFLSQSGETADSRQVLVKTNQLKYPSLTITNVPGSTLAREANDALFLEAGPEIAVASTKAYTAQITLLTIVANAVARQKGLKNQLPENLSKELSLVEDQMTQIIESKAAIHQIVHSYLLTTNNAFFIGRGIDYAVALEAALKLKEISYIQAEGFAAGELKHGTIALIETGTPVIGLITDDATHTHTRGNLEEVYSRGAKTLVFAKGSLSQPEDCFVLPDAPDYLISLVAIIPLQLLAYFASFERGYDVDKPRNLAKSVTVE